MCRPEEILEAGGWTAAKNKGGYLFSLGRESDNILSSGKLKMVGRDRTMAEGSVVHFQLKKKWQLEICSLFIRIYLFIFFVFWFFVILWSTYISHSFGFFFVRCFLGDVSLLVDGLVAGDWAAEELRSRSARYSSENLESRSFIIFLIIIFRIIILTNREMHLLDWQNFGIHLRKLGELERSYLTDSKMMKMFCHVLHRYKFYDLL